jgi:elongation factor 1-alpha
MLTVDKPRFKKADIKSIPLEKIQNNIDELTVVIVGSVDSSKCFGRGTKVILYDMSTKTVESLAAGDILMGDDMTARTVLEVHSGYGHLYKIIPDDGIEYIVNIEHILVLKNKDNIVEISVRDFLSNNEYQQYKWIRNSLSEYSQETNIRIIPNGLGEFFGFSVDRNQRFLLQDFSIAHNSTLVGVLSNPLLRTNPTENIKECLDDGNGKVRKLITYLRHEEETGRTSSISYTPILLDKDHWPSLKNSRTISVTDLCGHNKYLKTTVTGICSSYCDFAFVCVDRVGSRLNPMTCEHIKILLALRIPFAILITKIDLYSESELKHTLKLIMRFIKNHKKTIIIKNDADLEIPLDFDYYVPFLLISCKTGYGILRVLNFLTRIPCKKVILPPLFLIDSIFMVQGYGTVVSGYSGLNIKNNDKLMIGPFQSTKNLFCEVSIRSIHDNYKNFIQELEAGRRGCLCVRFATKDSQYRNKIKNGMIICEQKYLINTVSPEKEIQQTKLSNKFIADINVFNGHHTTIRTGFMALCNIGAIRATAKFTLPTDDVVRSGNIIRVELEFTTPICPIIGSEFIFREGVSIGHGKIIEAINSK